ncbi:MAG TPA: T9SS type A sorting domain-containing protein [Candidatus Kapabacteria bacterium]
MMSSMVRSILFGLLATLLLASKAEAQFIPYDSIPIDSIYGTDVGNPASIDSIEGAPDYFQAHMGGLDFFGVQFTPAPGQPSVMMDSGAILQVYWTRASTDSCAMDIQFSNPDGPTLGPTVHIVEAGPLYVPSLTNVIVPGSGFTTLGISVGSNPNAGEPGADSCFLDAIVLVQHGTYSSVSTPLAVAQPTLKNYPNPFYHSSGTHIAVAVPHSGEGTLLVRDAIGREVERIPLGSVSGQAEASLSLEGAGVYFVQLLIDGSPSGSPLEISSQ